MELRKLQVRLNALEQLGNVLEPLLLLPVSFANLHFYGHLLSFFSHLLLDSLFETGLVEFVPEARFGKIDAFDCI